MLAIYIVPCTACLTPEVRYEHLHSFTLLIERKTSRGQRRGRRRKKQLKLKTCTSNRILVACSPLSPPLSLPPASCSPQTSSALFFQYNMQLGPPYHVLVDTNFINFSIQNKLDIVSGMMDCLYAKCVPCITDCVVGELEKLGSRFRVAQRYE